MAAGVKLTKQFVATAGAKPAGFYWDAALPGFGLRVQASGAASYVVTYRPHVAGLRGRQVTAKRVTLGSTATLTPDAARQAAKKALSQIALGIDPFAVATPSSSAALTLKSIAESYLMIACGMSRDTDGKATFNGKLRSADQRTKVFERLVYPHAISNRHIGEIGRGDIVAFLDTIAATRGPSMAHLTLAYLSALFNWYAARSDTFRSPIVRGMSPIKAAQRARNRVLDDREIREIFAALDDTSVPPVFGRLVRVLLLTGLRRNEAARATWAEIDYLRRDDFEGDVLTIGAGRMKGKFDHAMPLTPHVYALLGQRTEGSRSYIFASTYRGGRLPFRNFATAKAALDAAANAAREKDGREPMPRWTLHDLRRTAKTLMQRAGVRPDISERVLAHSIRGVEGIYDRYGYLPEKLDALTKLNAIVERILRTIDW
jgi:integrase